jgi:hypothetical protein
LSRARRSVALLAAVALVALGLTVPALVAADTSLEVPVGFAQVPNGDGYWVVWPNGKVEARNGATGHGDATGIPLRQPIVGIASTVTGQGYWLVASDGGVFSFGDARFHGSTGGLRLNQPITGIASTASGDGYWLVASDGGVFAFGDARFHGSTGGLHLNSPISGIAASPNGSGYWIVAIDGGVFAFGDAPFQGSTGGAAADRWIRSITPTASGQGYWLAGIDGSVFEYGDAATGNHTPVVVGLTRAGSGWAVVMSNAPLVAPPSQSTPTTKAPTTTPTTSPTTAPPAAPPPPPPANVRTPAPSIDATGNRDVTAELQSFLDSVPHHATVSFPAGAKYRIEGMLFMSARNDIQVDGNGALFFATQVSNGTEDPRTRGQFKFQDMSNLLIEDLVIRGAHPSGGIADSAYVSELEAQHGIKIYGGERIEIRNTRITDVYGDFIYVGRSPHPIFGKPSDVWIHDNYFRRNGRQGIAVTHAFNVVIERNDIAHTRRATFDLEPASTTGNVRNVWIRANKVGPGRLMFVAGHGEGWVGDVYIQDNVLTGRSMGIDMVYDAPVRRQNIVVTGNTSDTMSGNGRGTTIRFVGYDHIDVRNNRQPMQPGRNMYLVGIMGTCKVTAANNDLAPGGVGQVKELTDTPYTGCTNTPPLTPAIRPTQFEGDRMIIDVGGTVAGFGMIACPTTDDCAGYYRGGPATAITAARGGTLPQRTMLHGLLAFGIPIRSGTYNVKLSFIEPVFDDPNSRRFHLDIENRRKESVFGVQKVAGDVNKLVERTYKVTVGDGVLNIDFYSGGTMPNAPIVSLIDIDRL